MPNWCYNKLTVEFMLARKLDEFIKDMAGSGPYYGGVRDIPTRSLTLHGAVPMPDSVAAGDKAYNWATTNWGTKWDISEAGCERVGPYRAVYRFDTAWSPPDPWIYKLAERYPDSFLRLQYVEPGCNFAGEYLKVIERKDVQHDDSIPVRQMYIELFGEMFISCEGCDDHIVTADPIPDKEKDLCRNCLRKKKASSGIR